MDAYAKAARISSATLGRLAGQGGGFYQRLSAGKRCWPETVAKVRAYMLANPPDRHSNDAPIGDGAHHTNGDNVNGGQP